MNSCRCLLVAEVTRNFHQGGTFELFTLEGIAAVTPGHAEAGLVNQQACAPRHVSAADRIEPLLPTVCETNSTGLAAVVPRACRSLQSAGQRLCFGSGIARAYGRSRTTTVRPEASRGPRIKHS